MRDAASDVDVELAHDLDDFTVHASAGIRFAAGRPSRVAAVGGALQIDSPVGHGTRLRASIPVPE
jgi:hypothetical protein